MCFKNKMLNVLIPSIVHLFSIWNHSRKEKDSLKDLFLWQVDFFSFWPIFHKYRHFHDFWPNVRIAPSILVQWVVPGFCLNPSHLQRFSFAPRIHRFWVRRLFLTHMLSTNFFTSVGVLHTVLPAHQWIWKCACYNLSRRY